MKKYFSLFAFIFSMNTFAGQPVFYVTPNLTGQATLVKGQIGTYIYQITNNTPYTLNNIGMVKLPAGVRILEPGIASGSCVTNPQACQYCRFPLTQTNQNKCLVKFAVDSNQINHGIGGGPQICYTYNRPVYCSQPFAADQLATQILPGPVSACGDNIDNFNYELSQSFDDAADYDADWGPARASFSLSSSNPDLVSCTSSLDWERKRILAAAKLWINQKLNYCEHHVPDFPTPVAKRGNAYGQGGYCNPIVDLAPNTFYYNQQARWNYSGAGSETLYNWVNNQAMWYGFDCSNYTAFLYDFALSINFNSAIQQQSGQIDQTSSAGPNNGGATTVSGETSGPLVCVDGTTTCSPSSGNYISTIDSSGTYHPDAVTIPLLTNALQPGDLLYIAGSLNERAHVAAVTHVIMWTGYTIGTGPNQINPSEIAPNELCPQYWQPQNGQPVINDSHYQGPDYRMLTQCFYLENVWAIRRPL